MTGTGKKTDLGTYNNDWYHCGAGFLKRGCWYLVNVLFFLNPLNPFSGLKCSLLKIFGAKLGKGVVIKPSVNIKYPWNLSIGNHVWIGERVWIDNLARVVIKDNVCISQEALILTGNHDYRKTGFDLIVKDIILEDGVWIAARSIVGPGVVAGSHAVLTAGSTATGDLQEYMIYRGDPAMVVKERRMQG